MFLVSLIAIATITSARSMGDSIEEHFTYAYQQLGGQSSIRDFCQEGEGCQHNSNGGDSGGFGNQGLGGGGGN